MKATGIIRKVDGLGRIVLPMELRKTLEIKGADHGEGTPLEIFVEGSDIILRKYSTGGCHCCENMEGLVEVMGLKICPKCLDELNKARELINKVRR
ncbi:AbrB/MazE/SpoVT family DNA-binding domain-containing protein [Clostridium botulinum]|uniref:AbrB/MazE/SpoVT family DNA-binding domain-containing protein n=1 Tax=Clostridium botulinum TaxID=1491 RepID=UPI00077416EB|nr:AbrB/MazE/SpoVT family DNA-binding domain-containing protein [Clostridium botulinum]MBY6932113.1 AbrB/MazE/SpoVT family DNA-binding domain-containing protein [Clostridium botulinum]NFG20333.1 AbrB/MazE/SpoVT family DNA-binding domain-containing protein [Clostridium botulinum]NFO82476.1 AbrB/MazE/SpoVT family DNA-binding domain-containing protein [Clostridium botulinum]